MRTVLFVEPDILVRSPLAAYLRDCGLRVLEASGHAEARAFLLEDSIPIDVMLIDCGSEEQAFELVRWARREFSGLDILIAAHAASVARKAGDLCAEADALAKPYDKDLVLARIRRAIAARERD